MTDRKPLDFPMTPGAMARELVFRLLLLAGGLLSFTGGTVTDGLFGVYLLIVGLLVVGRSVVAFRLSDDGAALLVFSSQSSGN